MRRALVRPRVARMAPASLLVLTACASIVGDFSFASVLPCNPINNDGCTDGYWCDQDIADNGTVTTFSCFTPGDMTAGKACDPTASDPNCTGGTTCEPTGSSDTSGQCALYCCNTADCGQGCTCAPQSAFKDLAPALGVCTDTTGNYKCNPPATPLPGTSCVTVAAPKGG